MTKLLDLDARFLGNCDDLTLMPSVNCDVPHKDAQGVEHPSSCKFHGWVKNGDVA